MDSMYYHKRKPVEKVQSAGGVVYYIDKEINEPRFLLLKRHALSKKIERIAPKGKIKNGELPEQAALREIEEEVGLKKEYLQVKQVLDTLSLQLYNNQGRLWVDKDITYFLMYYKGDPDYVKVIDGEWFTGVYKWARLEDVLILVEYRDLRELFRQAYQSLWKITVKDEFIKNL